MSDRPETVPPEAVLIVEDNAGLRRQMAWTLDDSRVVQAGDRRAALNAVRAEAPPVVVLDLGLPPDADGATEGLATLEAIRRQAPAAKVIVLTGNEDEANALRAVALGAYDYCRKPLDAEMLRLLVQRARNLSRLERELARTRGEVAALPGFVTAAPSAREMCRIVTRIAPTDVTVLVLGESGTGKELVAGALHQLSPLAGKPFIAVNCGAIPENLLEAEMFGFERGAFTGAIRRSIGKVEQAAGGTLFLDEIGDIPPSLQVKLLRFLQERSFERIGGRERIRVDVRIVAATNRDLTEMVAAGAFREDLYYRLDEISVRIPALRERPGDAALLGRKLLGRYAAQYRRSANGFAEDAWAALAAHPWPGNVRELQSRVKRAVLMAEGGLITAADLELDGGDREAAPSAPRSLREARQQAERQALLDALLRARGNVSEAARLLAVSRPTLYALIRQYAVDPATIKNP